MAGAKLEERARPAERGARPLLAALIAVVALVGGVNAYMLWRVEARLAEVAEGLGRVRSEVEALRAEVGGIGYELARAASRLDELTGHGRYDLGGVYDKLSEIRDALDGVESRLDRLTGYGYYSLRDIYDKLGEIESALEEIRWKP